METLAASKEPLMKTPALLLLADNSASVQACGADKFAYTPKGTADFPANIANPGLYTAPPTCATFKKKKKKTLLKMKKKTKTMLSVGRSECRQHINASRWLRKFRKRRNELFTKARELSNLCNAEVAAIVVSPSGKVSQFASSSMSHILKRYQSFQPQMRSNNVLLHGVKRWRREAVLLNSKLKDLQGLKRFSKNKPSLSNVVEGFESMLVHTLDEIHKKKMELLEVEIQEMVQQEEILVNENIMLEEKIAQIMSTKECISNALSGSEEFCYQ